MGPALVLAVPVAAFLAWRLEAAWLLTAAFLLTPIAGNWEQLGIPGPAAPDRLLLIAGIASVLLRTGDRDNPEPLRLSGVHLLMILGVAFVGFSAAFAGTITDVSIAAKLFDAYGVTPFLVFLVAPIAFREERQRQILLVGLVAFGAYLSLTTIFERLSLDPLVWPQYILDRTVGIHFGRGRGPFVEAVTNGFALFTCAVASMIAYTQWRGRPRSDIAGVVALLCVAGIVLTLQRSVWLAAIAAALVTIMTLTGERRAALRALAATVVVTGLALLVIPGLYGDVASRFDDERSVHDRENLTRAAINMIEDRPLTGFGWGTFTTQSGPYFEQADTYNLGNINGTAIHSTFLTYAVELGLIGAIIWVAIVALGILGGLPRRGPPDVDDWRVGLVAIAVAYAVITNFVPPQVFPNLTLWLWAGVCWVGFQEPNPPRDAPSGARNA